MLHDTKRWWEGTDGGTVGGHLRPCSAWDNTHRQFPTNQGTCRDQLSCSTITVTPPGCNYYSIYTIVVRASIPYQSELVHQQLTTNTRTPKRPHARHRNRQKTMFSLGVSYRHSFTKQIVQTQTTDSIVVFKLPPRVQTLSPLDAKSAKNPFFPFLSASARGWNHYQTSSLRSMS